MKNILKLLAIALSIGVLASCEDEPKRDPSPAPPTGTLQEISFDEGTYEGIYEPDDEKTITLTLHRNEDAASQAVTADLSIAKIFGGDRLSTDIDIFDIPSTVSFGAGETTASITITFPELRARTNYRFLLQVGDYDNSNPYINPNPLDDEGKPIYDDPNFIYQITEVKITGDLPWVDFGQFIYRDGALSAFFAVDPEDAWWVDAQTAVWDDNDGRGEVTYYRLVNVYNTYATDEDANGILDGFPYNDPEDIVRDETFIVLEVDPKKNSEGKNNVMMDGFAMGMDWGYGSEMTLNPIDGEYGEYDEEKGIIIFEPETLSISIGSQLAARASTEPTIIFMSLEAYLAYDGD